MAETALVLALSYLLGSIPFSFLVARWFGVEDVRRVGSGNVGATNVMRSAGRTAGTIAFLLDASKGAAAAWAAGRMFGTDGWLPAGAAFAAILGHMHPVWLAFRGGKGVATGAGAFLPLAPGAAVGGLLTFALALLLTRYVSVASMAGALMLAALTFVLGEPRPTSAAALVAALLIVFKHRDNVRRLAQGTERRVGGASKAGAAS
jgi:glycerol-3-phosphate acyltransferase PlsY